MYLSSTMGVDPSQETIIEKVKPTKIFGRMVDFMTAGLASKKEEVETFTAIAILQQINRAARVLKITNVVRLSKDDFDFYFDEEGRRDDLKEAMDSFRLEAEGIESEIFKTVSLVLEHEDELLKYLVEIDISRKHRVGEYPVKIRINGLIKDFRKETDESVEEFKRRQQEAFSSQEAYEEYVHGRRTQFDSFVEQLEFELKKAIKIDDIRVETKSKLVRAKERTADAKDIRHIRDGYNTDPLFYGYYGFDAYFFSTMLWADMMFANNIYCHDMTIIDAEGHNVMDVGEEGFYAGDSNTLNVDEDFEAPESGDVQYYGENEFEDQIAEAGYGDGFGDEGPEGDSSDSFDFGGDGGDADGGSSCSSCGGCGD